MNFCHGIATNKLKVPGGGRKTKCMARLKHRLEMKSGHDNGSLLSDITDQIAIQKEDGLKVNGSVLGVDFFGSSYLLPISASNDSVNLAAQGRRFQ